jgi:hypothetical protein
MRGEGPASNAVWVAPSKAFYKFLHRYLSRLSSMKEVN